VTGEQHDHGLLPQALPQTRKRPPRGPRYRMIAGAGP
jgi:hypothetical protein